MREVTKHNLNQNTASILREVTDVEDIVVTEHGKPRWRISSYQHKSATLTALERKGLYTPPSARPAPWPTQPGGPKYSGEAIDDLLGEMRGMH